MTDQTIQNWTEKYNDLTQQLDTVRNALKIYSNGKSPAIFEAQRLQLRLEYQINQHIDSAYTPTLIDTYLAYQNQKIDIKTNIPIDGILYNNIGQPLTWNPDATWGLFNQFKEARNYVRTLADYHLAGWMQDKRAVIVALFSGLANEALDPSDKVFGSVLVNSNPYLQKMAEMVLGQALGKAMPDNKAIVKVSYDNVYEYFFGDYDPALEGLVLDPLLLKDTSQAFFQSVEGSQIQSAIEHLTAPNSGPSSLLGLLKQKLNDLNIGSGAVIAPSQNPNTIFDLSVDPSGLKPTNPNITNSVANYQSQVDGTAFNTRDISSAAMISMINNQAEADGSTEQNNLTAQMNALRQQMSAEGQGAGNISFTDNLNVTATDTSEAGLDTVSGTYNSGQTWAITGTYVYGSGGNKPTALRLNKGQLYTNNAGVTKTSNGNEIMVFDVITKTTNPVNPLQAYNIPAWHYTYLDTNAILASLLPSPNRLSTLTVEVIGHGNSFALDTGNDGVLLGGSRVKFDLNADGKVKTLNWTAPTDPLLVMDINGDGRINNGSELVDITDNTTPINLLSLDSVAQGGNNDKKLTDADSAFAKLQLWSDRNQDGYAGSGELQSLADLGIVSIDLDPTHLQTSTTAQPIAGKAGVKGVIATYADGSTRTLWDVPFTDSSSPVNSTITSYQANIDKITTNGQIALRSNSQLGVSINLNGSGAAQALGDIGNDILTGTDGSDTLIGGAGADIFNAGAGNDLLVMDAEDNPKDIQGGAGIDTILVADDRGVFLNLAQSQGEVVYGGYGDDVLIGGGADNYFIDGAAGDDLIVGGSADDVLSGADGEDILQGGQGDDLMRGGRDDDQLLGGEGNDVLDGGLGNDTLAGDSGNDVIIASGGTDIVDGGAGTDLIELQGALQDYSFGKNADGSYTVTDKKNLDGSAVAVDKISNRDGVQNIKNVERLSYQRGQLPVVVTLDSDILPTDDQVRVNTAQSSYSIAVSTLLANDINLVDLTNQQLSVYSVGDAIGGSVTLSADQQSVIFTPTAGYHGVQEFSYTIRDALGHLAPTVTNTINPITTGELKGRVLLVASDAPVDPAFGQQWYLKATGTTQAWKDGYTGKGVKVLVLEPSSQYAGTKEVADLNNPDLVANKSGAFQDTVANSVHATQVAGVIGAAKNGIGSVGVAYNATLDAVSFTPILGGSVDLKAYQREISVMKNFDVVNNSWSHSSPWGMLDSSTAALQYKMDIAAIKDAATSGRNGLGTVMVFSAGNDRAKGYDAGLSTLTSNPYTINVGAINRVDGDGTNTLLNKPFSNRGANILLSAPGSHIVTTNSQVTTADGATFGDTTIDTQGSSFAAPVVAGVVALMLEANVKLTYRDVQTILAYTATKTFVDGTQGDTVWDTNKDTDWNGVGMHFSHDFGFGMVDAAAAVRLAASWDPASSNGWQFGDDALRVTGALQSAAGIAIADLGRQELKFVINDALNVEQVMLNLKLDHQRWSDLVVTLISPDGTHSVLLDRPGFQDGQTYLGNPAGATYFNKELMSVHFRGETSLGTWTLVVEDKAGMTGAKPVRASIVIEGTDTSALKRYIVTDEYAGNKVLNPIVAGLTELNLGAVSNAVKIDLSGGASLVNGKALTVNAGIDRLIGSFFNDTLQGGAGNEEIVGGQGNDVLSGGVGEDELIGGQGNDALSGGDGQDTLVGGDGVDTLTGGANTDVFLINGDNASTTIITDFTADASGDTVQIHRAAAWSFNDIVQTQANGNLTLSFNADNGGVSNIVLQGFNSRLNTRQLKALSLNEQIVTAPGSTADAGIPGSVVYVDPLYTISSYLTRDIREVGSSGSVSGYGYVPYALYSEHSVGPAYSDGRVHLNLNPGSVNGVGFAGISSSNAYFGSYILFDPRAISVSYNPQNPLSSLLQTLDYGNVINYKISDLHWRSGTDASETLVSGGMPAKPAMISQADWDAALLSLGRRGYYGYGGNDFIIGGSDNEVLDGGIGMDMLNAGGGDDGLYGGDDSDVLNGESGDDNLDGGSDNDTLTGGTGNDTLTGGADADYFVFSAGSQADTITDLELIDTLQFNGIVAANVNRSLSYSGISQYGFNVSTSLSYGTGDSVYLGTRSINVASWAASDAVLYNATYGGSARQSALLGYATTTTVGVDVILQDKFGSKIISAQGGDDVVYALNNNGLNINGDGGNDTIFALEGGNTINGGNDNDLIEITSSTAAGGDLLIGGAGQDSIRAGSHGAVLYGDDTANTLVAASITDHTLDDSLYGGAGADTLYGGGGNDSLSGGDGYDSLLGGTGDDTLDGGIGNDTLDGGTGIDMLRGGDGNDILTGGAGQNALNGGVGDDSLTGGNDGNSLSGGDGIDTLMGGSGIDVLSGGAGNDSLVGGASNDMLLGGTEDDTLTGGIGDDYLETGSGNDLILLDSTSGNDIAEKLTGTDTVQINGVTNYTDPNQFKFELLNNGAQVKLSWGSDFTNSLTLSSYEITTKFSFPNATVTANSSATLRTIFENWGFYPDDSFDYLGQYDTQLVGSGIGTLMGSGDNDALYGGPLGTTVEDPTVNGTRSGNINAAYWYVTGGQGNDSLAAGVSGGVLDGGLGNDTLRTSNGVTVVRDTFHGGQDTLVMPFGTVPEGLKFFRIPNVMEAAYQQQNNDYAYISAPLTKSQTELVGTAISPNLWRYGDTNYNKQQYDYTPPQRPEHYDTLRIQSAGGKFTVDVAGYFETGVWKNDIANIIFPTVFDATGHSTSYSIDSLIAANDKSSVYQYKDPQLNPGARSSDTGYVSFYVNNPGEDKSFYAATVSLHTLLDTQVIIGSEIGTTLTTGKTLNVYEYTNYKGYSTNPTYLQNLNVSATEYQVYKTEATKKKTGTNLRDFTYEYNYLTNTQTNVNTLFKGLEPPKSVKVTAQSFTTVAITANDEILGFGGNDKIDAAGSYIETHYSGAIYYSWGVPIANELSGATDFTREFKSGLVDKINGGAGDDTYIYRRGYGNLDIIALDERLKGAEGTDTLDMHDFNWNEVIITASARTVNRNSSYRVDYEAADVTTGAFTIQVLDHQTYDGFDGSNWKTTTTLRTVNGKISVYGGVGGEYQVDKIIFKDKTVDVRTLLNTLTAADGRTYLPSKLGVSTSTTDDTGTLNLGLDATAILNGTPASDIMLVGANGVVQGHESGDYFLVDMDTTEFAVIAMDKGDKVRFGSYARNDFANFAPVVANLEVWNQFAGVNDPNQQYLGKTQVQWLASGVLPVLNTGGYGSWAEEAGYGLGDMYTFNFSSFNNLSGTGYSFVHKVLSIDATYTPVYASDDFTNYAVQWGKLNHAHTGSTTSYSLADWSAADSLQGFAPDALVSWDTTSTTGAVVHHSTVLVGVTDSNYVMYALLSGLSFGFRIGTDYYYQTVQQSAGATPPPLRGTEGNDYIAKYRDLSPYSEQSPYSDQLDSLGNAIIYTLPASAIYALGGDDTIAGYANDTGADANNNHVQGPNLELHGGDGNDSLEGGAGNDQLFGDSGNDALIGGIGNDTLDGAINDMLNGVAGSDSLAGGAGDDVYLVNANDTIVEHATETFMAFTPWIETLVQLNPTGSYSFVDTAPVPESAQIMTMTWITHDFRDTAPSAAENPLGYWRVNGSHLWGENGHNYYIVYNQHTATRTLISTQISDGTDEVRGDLDIDLSNVKYSNVENVTALGTGAHHLTGNSGNNILTGNGAGSTLEGLAGDDTYIADNDKDLVIEAANGGNDTIKTSIDMLALAANLENLVSTGISLNLFGNSLANSITGDVGNNVIDGGAGKDTMTGGAGDDVYTADNAADVLIEAAGEGYDVLWVQRDYTLNDSGSNDIEEVRAVTNFGVQMTGNSLNNLLVGATGDDTLSGGAGADSMYGGAGDDVYDVDSTSDVITENFDGGTDTIQSSIDYKLAPYTSDIENLTLIGNSAIHAEGNWLSNVLTGNALDNILIDAGAMDSNDTLDGGLGADYMDGSYGSDTYIVDNIGDVVHESQNLVWDLDGYTSAGYDTVFSSVDYSLSANVETLILGGDATTATGNDKQNWLIGNALNNTLVGNGGDDYLDGQSGADTMRGGLGNDSYVIDNTNDQVFEGLEEGNDRVISSVSFTLKTNIENLSLTGTDAIDGVGNTLNNSVTGNEAANILNGNAGNDRLYGYGGADTLIGEMGNDYLYGGSGNDTYILGRGYGTDSVVENDATAGNTDIAQFLSGVGADQIWFQHVNNNLEASIIGSTDKLVIKDWYLSTANHVEQFKTTDGAKTLLDSNVQNLVNAMAAFAPPAAGQSTLPQNYQTALAPVIAANWQ